MDAMTTGQSKVDVMYAQQPKPLQTPGGWLAFAMLAATIGLAFLGGASSLHSAGVALLIVSGVLVLRAVRVGIARRRAIRGNRSSA